MLIHGEEEGVPPKKKRKSRSVTKPGRPISFYELMMLISSAFSKYRSTTGPGHDNEIPRSVYIWANSDKRQKTVPLVWLAQRPLWYVWNLAQGQVAEVVYLEGHRCRCRLCDHQKVKKPRGPKRQKDGTITKAAFYKYRGAGTGDQMMEWRRLCPELVEEDEERERKFREYCEGTKDVIQQLADRSK